jgi:hypothetical protein
LILGGGSNLLIRDGGVRGHESTPGWDARCRGWR